MKPRRKIIKVKYGESVPNAKLIGIKKCIESVEGELRSVKYAYYEVMNENQ